MDQEASPEQDPLPPSPAISLRDLRRFSTFLYVAMALVALVWIWADTGRWLPGSVPGRDPLLSLALGAVTAVLTVGLTAMLLRSVRWMRWLAGQIRQLIGSPDAHTAFHVALVSGIGEELFFRGAMQPELGYVPTSILFGVLHTGPDRKYLVWTAFALVLGFALGGIYELTGSLVGPVLAHFLINFLNLLRIGKLEVEEEVRSEVGTARAASEPTGSPGNQADSV